MVKKCRWMSAIYGPVLPAGMVGSVPGLTGGIKEMRLSVVYLAGRTVDNRKPRAPLSTCDWTEAESALS